MLPAEALLILVAAWGIGQIRSGVVRWLAVIGAAALVLLNWPYLLMHYNVLLGGAPEAQNHFAVGWGEGLGAAANWINRQPDGLQATAATTAVPSFAPIFSGQSRNTVRSRSGVVRLLRRHAQRTAVDPRLLCRFAARGEVVQTLRTGAGRWRVGAAQQAGALAGRGAAAARNPQTDAIVTLIDLPVARAVCRRRASW